MRTILLILIFTLASCISPLEKGSVDIDLKNVPYSKSKPTISNVTLENDQLKINGANFNNLKLVKLNTQNLSVISNSGSQLILSASSAMTLALNTILNLVVETASGATSVAVTFNLVDGSVTASKIGDGEIGANHLSSMGAGTGQVMQWNGTTWVAADLSGLVYLGGWDATTAAPSASSAGEYYIISNAGTTNLSGINSWSIGDWAVFDGTNWAKIDNSTGVKTFNGRSGVVTSQANDYTWNQIDKTTSSINDIADVDTAGVSVNDVLKWDGSMWTVAPDETVTAGSVTSGAIADGTIQSQDLNAALNTTLTQVGTNTSDIATNASAIATNAGNISTNATSIAGHTTSISNLTSTKADKTITVNGQALNANVTLDSDDVAEGIINLYYSETRAKGDLIVNSSAGSETDQAASVAAMKSYVTTAITGVGASDFVHKDGSVAMTGALESASGGVKLRDGDSNFVTLRSHSNIAADLNFILPNSAGTSGFVLSTDGAGNLSWIAPTTGSVTGVSVSAPIASTGGTTPTLSITQATTTTNGYLSSTDWNTFNTKQAAITTGTTAQYMRGDLSLGVFASDVASSILTGFAVGANSTVLNTDTVETSIEKLQGQINATNTSVSAKENSITAGTTAQYWRGDKSWQTLDKSAVGLLNVTNDAQLPLAYRDNGALSTSTTNVPTSNAVKSYVDSATSALTSSQWTTTGSDIYYNSGNVGIGTTSPGKSLTVVGSALIGSTTTGFVNTWNSLILGNTALGPHFIMDGGSTANRVRTLWNSSKYSVSKCITDTCGSTSAMFSFDTGTNIFELAGNSKISFSGSSPTHDIFFRSGTDKSIGFDRNNSTASNLTINAAGPAAGSLDRDGGDVVIKSGISTGTGSSEIQFWTTPAAGSGTIDNNPIIRMTIDPSGNVGIGTTTPTEKLHVSGNVIATAYLYTSDMRFKTNIKTVNEPLDKISKLRGVTFDWRAQEFPERNFPEQTTYGFIAQEVEQVVPELVKTSEDGFKSVHYANLTSLIVEGIKEIQKKISSLFKNDEELKREIASLKEENELLKSQMNEVQKDIKKMREEFLKDRK